MELRRLSVAASAAEVAKKVLGLLETPRNPQGQPAEALLLPTGSSPQALYSILREQIGNDRRLLSAWRSFQLDEFWPCPAESPISFRAFLEQELCQPLGLAPQQASFLDGTCPEADIARHCAAYEEAMQKAGGIGLAILGIGINGHLAFNEPETPWDSRTRRVSLSSTTRTRPTFPRGEEGPTMALTVGLGTILEARRIVVLASGTSKAEALKRMLTGEPGLDCPASCLRTHPQVTVYADADACSLLPT